MRVSEVELIPDFSQSQRYKHPSVRSDKNTIKDKIKSNVVHRLGTIKNHTIYVDQSMKPDEFTNARFYAVNNKTGLVDMTFDGKMKNRKKYISFDINTLEGRSGSSLKAHELYRAVLLLMPIIFVSDLQSYGGMRTWQELSKYPDIDVFGWRDNEPVNIDPLDSDETHVSDDDVWLTRDPQLRKELQNIKNMKLVAHRKIEKRGR